ncbi:hypothetical protein LY76DRAFT_516810, partial [Colletotrichum caudatum]
ALVRMQKLATPAESLSDITKNFGTVHCQRLEGRGEEAAPSAPNLRRSLLISTTFLWPTHV